MIALTAFRFFRRRATVLATAAAAVVLASCTTTGDIASPVSRQATWYSFLNGDDIRRSCRPGTDRARLVYNGRYTDQVRVYELRDSGSAASLDGRVFSGTGLFGMEGGSLGPIRGQTFRTGLNADTAAGLWRRLEAAGAFQPAPRLTLEGEEVWWLTVGCRDGEVFFHAWEAGRAGYPGRAFEQALAPLDTTGVAFAPVKRRGPPIEMDEDAERFRFRVEIAPGGLVHR